MRIYKTVYSRTAPKRIPISKTVLEPRTPRKNIKKIGNLTEGARRVVHLEMSAANKGFLAIADHALIDTKRATRRGYFTMKTLWAHNSFIAKGYVAQVSPSTSKRGAEINLLFTHCYKACNSDFFNF